jgi:predicted AAA+ superfamily ATPase
VRYLYAQGLEAPTHAPAVVLLGTRQVGKTTVAIAIGREIAAVYLALKAVIRNPIIFRFTLERLRRLWTMLDSLMRRRLLDRLVSL